MCVCVCVCVYMHPHKHIYAFWIWCYWNYIHLEICVRCVYCVSVVCVYSIQITVLLGNSHSNCYLLTRQLLFYKLIHQASNVYFYKYLSKKLVLTTFSLVFILSFALNWLWKTYTIVPSYSSGIYAKIPIGGLKQQIVLNTVYTMFFSIHTYRW